MWWNYNEWEEERDERFERYALGKTLDEAKTLPAEQLEINKWDKNAIKPAKPEQITMAEYLSNQNKTKTSAYKFFANKQPKNEKHAKKKSAAKELEQE